MWFIQFHESTLDGDPTSTIYRCYTRLLYRVLLLRGFVGAKSGHNFLVVCARESITHVTDDQNERLPPVNAVQGLELRIVPVLVVS